MAQQHQNLWYPSRSSTNLHFVRLLRPGGASVVQIQTQQLNYPRLSITADSCNHPNLYAVLNSGCDRSQAWRSFPSCRLLKTYVGPIPFDGFEPDSISSECGVLPNGFVRGGHRSEHFLSFRYRENAGDSMHAQPHFRTLFHSKYFCNSIDFKNEIERKDFQEM